MGPGVAWADLKANDPAPPLPLSQIITVYRGEATLIPLTAQGRLANESRFILRTLPKWGTLSEIEPVSPGSAIVRYRHKDQNGTGEDTFTYAAQAPGSPVSAPARIRIRVVERPANFLTAAQLEFGKVMTSESGEQELTIENSGGNRVQGKIQVPAPWKVLGAPSYDLGRGESATFRLAFSPSDERDYVGKIHFSHDAKAETILHGQGEFPFRITPNTVDLPHPTRSVNDSQSVVTVSNPQPQPLTLKIEAPSFVNVPTSLEIPAGGESELLLKANPETMMGGEGKIRLIHDKEEREITVRVFAAPAKIVTEPDAEFDLGKVSVGETLRGYFRLINRGGSTTEIQIEAPQTLTLANSLNLTLSPEQKQEVHFLFEPKKAENYAEPLTVRYADQTLVLKIVAQVIATNSAPKKLAGNISPETRPEPAPNEAAVPTIPFSFEKLYVVSQTYHTVKVAWPKPKADAPAAYRIDRRKITRDEKGNVQEFWEPLPGITYAEEGNAITAEITGLFANQGLSVRVFSLDPAGNVTAASRKFSVATRTYVATQTPKWVWGIPVIGILFGFLRFVRRRRLQTQDEDQARIEKITRI